MKEGNNSGSIPPLTAKTLIELDTFDVSGINILFYYFSKDIPNALNRKEYYKKDYFYSMILVTGGTGLVGSHLLYFLLKGKKQISPKYQL